ncbi:MAG: hypothetical protein KDA96_08825 [Planctomycetaceae bacterium]|nr:hypothetical protein [Planctomycetaceae bacterium]
MDLSNIRSARLFAVLAVILVGLHPTETTWATRAASPQQGKQSTEPASVESAAGILDLRKLKLPDDAEPVSDLRLAGASYKMKASVKDALTGIRKQLIGLGCKEADGTVATDEYASATFQKADFRIAVMVLPNQPGEVMVTVDNLSNLDLSKLPLPNAATPQFASAAMAMYQVDAGHEKVKEEISSQMVKSKWEPYGTAGDQLFFRRNAVIASINCMAAPGQDGKSIVQYSARLVSAEIPLPASASDAQYADVTQELSFTTKDDVAQVSQFYAKSLASSGWKPTAEAPAPVDFDLIQIFAQEKTGQLMRLMIREVKDEGHLKVRMKLWRIEEEKE